MPDQTNLVQCIYSAIFSGLGGTLGSDASSFLSLEWPGNPIDESEYGNPWSAANLSGSQHATEAFSFMADQIPALSAQYETTGLGVESVYSMALSATVGGASGPASAVAKAFVEAQGNFADSSIPSADSPGVMYHPSYPEPLNWCNAHSPGWTDIHVTLGTSPAPLPQVAKGPVSSPPPPPHFLTAVSNAIASQSGLLGWRSAAVDVAAVHKIVAPPQILRRPMMAAAGHAASFTPGTGAFAGEIPRSTVMMNRALQVRTVSQVLSRPPVRPIVTLPFSIGLFGHPSGSVASAPTVHPAIPVPVVAAETVQARPVTSSSLTLTLSCQRVNIRRTWLNPLLLKLGGWSLDGVPAGSMSSGTTDASNTGFFPLLPTAFIVVRSISISGVWSSDDKAFASQATSDKNVVAFGPLTLANSAAGQSTFNGQTLTVPGMQVLAWISAPLPKLPPA